MAELIAPHMLPKSDYPLILIEAGAEVKSYLAMTFLIITLNYKSKIDESIVELKLILIKSTL